MTFAGSVDDLGAILIAVVIAAFGGVGLYWRIREVRRQQAAGNWLVADGEITSSDWMSPAGDGDYRLDVYYQFKVGEEIYTGTETFIDRTPALTFHRPDGSKIKVRYRPDDPQNYNALRWRDQEPLRPTAPSPQR